MLSDPEQKLCWQVVSGTYERASEWRGAGEPPWMQRKALISWRAIKVKRVLNTMKQCTVTVQRRPGGFTLTKHFTHRVTTVMWQLFTAAALSICGDRTINIFFTLTDNLDILEKQQRYGKGTGVWEHTFRILQVSVWHADVHHTDLHSNRKSRWNWVKVKLSA